MKANISTGAKELKDGIYEISVKVSTNISARTVSEVIAYAGEAEIMTGAKIDQSKVNDIALK